MKMKTIMSFLVIAVMFMVGIKTPKAEEVCYDGVCFPGGDASFADSVVSYDPSTDVEPPFNNPTSVEGSPDYEEEGEDGKFVSLGCNGVLVVQFTDNSLTTSDDSYVDLWIFEIGASISGGTSEPTNIDISTDGVNWIDVGSTSGDTSGIDIDAYIGSGVEQGEHYSYVRITDKNCVDSGLPYAGADIDAIGAIESAAPVTTTTTTADESTTTTTADESITTTTTTSGECAPGCPDSWLGDDYCDEVCNVAACNYDNGDCGTNTTTTTSGECAPGCPDYYLGDSECDSACNVAACNYDNGDCGDTCTSEFIYGEHAEKTELLRNFRDNVLSQTPEGQEIIRLYYQWSPAIVKAMEGDKIFKGEIKEIIDGFLALIGGSE